MFAHLSCLQPVFVDTTTALGADSPLVWGYGMARSACPADARPDDRVSVELWVPGADLWATVGTRTLWSGETDEEDEWEEAGECPAIVTVPRRDVWTLDEVGPGIGPDDPTPLGRR